MFNYRASQMWIGGKVPAQLVPALCDEINAAVVALDYNAEGFTPTTETELLEACVDYESSPVLYFGTTQTGCSPFRNLSEFLQEHDISFTCRKAGNSAGASVLLKFRGGSDRSHVRIDSTGAPVVDMNMLRRINESLTKVLAAEFGRAIRLLKDLKADICETLPPDLPPLAPFQIVPINSAEKITASRST